MKNAQHALPAFSIISPPTCPLQLKLPGRLRRLHSISICCFVVLASVVSWAAGSGNAQIGQSAQTRSATFQTVIAPTILTPAESSTVGLPFQISFEFPEGVSAENYVLEIAYFHPQQNKWMYVGLFGNPFSGQTLTVTGQQLAAYSSFATQWQIRIRMDTPPGPWSVWRTFSLSNPPTSGLHQGPAGAVSSQPAGAVSTVTATLGVAEGLIGGTQKWSVGPAETAVYQANPSLHLAWESPFQNQYQWRWQLSTQPFPNDGSSEPKGMIDSDAAAGGNFYIDMGKYLVQSQSAGTAQRASTLSAGTGTTARRTQKPSQPSGSGRATTLEAATSGARTYYVRLLPYSNGSVSAVPSNTVTVHVRPGENPSNKSAQNAIAKDQADKAQQQAWAEANRIYSVKILSWTPAVLEDPNRWGCVEVVKNPVGFPNPIAAYTPGEYCPPKDPETMRKSAFDWFVIGISGYLKAYDGLVTFYNGAKSYIADHIKDIMPCEELGEAAQGTCEDITAFAVKSAISAGMVAAGIPPEYPTMEDLKAAAEGKIADAAITVSCDTVEANGGVCTPEMKMAMKTAYTEGIKKLENDLASSKASEPACGDKQAAKEHGRLPLPCFTDYPGIEVHPATGSVYEPPVLKVRVTKIKPSPYESGTPVPPSLKPVDCKVTAGIELSNVVDDKTISGIYYGHAELNGRPFDFATAYLPQMAVGQTVEVPLAFTKMMKVDFPNTIETQFNKVEWAYLYVGGQGAINVSSTCAVNQDQMPVTIPKK